MKLKLTYQQSFLLLQLLNGKTKFNKLDTAGRRNVLRIIRALRSTMEKWQAFLKETNEKFPDETESKPVIEAEFVSETEVDAEPLTTEAVDALIDSNPDWDIATADFIDQTLGTAPAPEPAAATE